MNRQDTKHAKIRISGFVSHEFFFAIAGLMVCLGLCLPILAAMKSGQVSLLVGGIAIAAICSVLLIPRLQSALSERSWRRRVDDRERQDHES